MEVVLQVHVVTKNHKELQRQQEGAQVVEIAILEWEDHFSQRNVGITL